MAEHVSGENPNPYAVSPLPRLTGTQFKRPLSCGLVACMHVIGYSILVLLGVALLLSIVFGVDGLSSARSDEVALAVLAICAAPFAGWLVLMEIRCFRFPTEQRERLLSRMAMLATTAPAIMSGFWFYEYLAFGYYELNAIPGFQAAACSLLWFGSGAYRFVMLPQDVSDIQDTAPVSL